MNRIAEPELLALIAGARAQDKAALEQLSRLVRDRFKDYFVSRVGQVESSDLAQDATLQVALHLEGFRGNSEKEFWGWARTVARNAAAASRRRDNALKRGKPASPLPEDSRGGVYVTASDETPSTIAVGIEQAAEVRAAFALLPPQEQAIIRMRNDEGKDWPDVAADLGKTVEAARKAYHRAIRKWAEKCREL